MEKTAWVVAVDMGYGHQRAAYPLLPFAKNGRIVTANNYEGIPEADLRLWRESERFYNFISRFKSKGALGRLAFNVFDRFQRIDEFYPLKNHLEPTLQLKSIYANIKKGWGLHLINSLSAESTALATPFFTIAFMAEYWKYPGPIYLIVTDADISRVWAPLEPASSKIVYLASTERAAARLTEYGVRPAQIKLTGFPLPKDLTGEQGSEAKRLLKRRLSQLDPTGIYHAQFGALAAMYLKNIRATSEKIGPIRIVFAVGGAGAQSEIGIAALRSLAPLIKKRMYALDLVAGISETASKKFNDEILRLGLSQSDGVSVLYETSKENYFRAFNELLTRCGVLWTKPSELSFYCALGIPIIIAPPIGAQEVQNRKWLTYLGAGFDQLDPSVANEWLPDFVNHGKVAEAAMAGFIKAPRRGLENTLAAIFG